jgi:uncharacterized RDD family membrane protein YckC
MASQVPTLFYASLGRRLMALCLDGLILAIPCTFANAAIPFVGGMVVWFLYAPLLEASEIRATLGKYLLGIQVVDHEGGTISLKASLVRNVLKCLSTVLACLGFLFALFNDKKQTVHDLVADTVVVNGKSSRSIPETWADSVRHLFPWEGWGKKNPESTISQLERIEALRKSGALTDEEFQAQKQKILRTER